MKFKTRCLGMVAIALIQLVLPTAGAYCREQVIVSHHIDLDTISIDLVSYNRTDLLKVISDLAGKAGVEFWVDSGIKNVPVTIELRNTTVSGALKTILRSCSSGYRFDLVTLGNQGSERNVLIVGINNCDPHAWLNSK